MVRKRSGFGRGFFPQLRSSKFKTRQTKGIVKLSVGPNSKVQFLKKILALIKNGISASQNFFGKPTYWLISRQIMNFSFDFDSFQFAKIFEIFPGKIKELTDFHSNTYRNFDSHHFHVYNMFFCCLKKSNQPTIIDCYCIGIVKGLFASLRALSRFLVTMTSTAIHIIVRTMNECSRFLLPKQ